MKALIDEFGTLLVERKGKWKSQLCPFLSDGDRNYCGDWCPLFEEIKTANLSKIQVFLNCTGGSNPIRHDIDEDQRQ